MLHCGDRQLLVFAGDCGQDDVNSTSQLHQGLQVVHFPVQFPEHLREEMVHAAGHAVVGKVELYEEVAHMETEGAEPLVRQVLVDELQQQAELLLLPTGQGLHQAIPPDELQKQTEEKQIETNILYSGVGELSCKCILASFWPQKV